MRSIAYCLLPIAILLAGCGGDKPIDIDALKLPSPRLMREPAPLPEPPQDDGDPATRAEHYAKSARVHGVCTAQVSGLQRYARAVAGGVEP